MEIEDRGRGWRIGEGDGVGDREYRWDGMG